MSRTANLVVALFAFSTLCAFLQDGNIISGNATAFDKQLAASDAIGGFSVYVPIIYSPPVPTDWEQVGLVGEDITDIYISTSSKHIFTSAYNAGLFESRDNGLNWQKHQVPPRINDIEPHPNFPNVMYLATWSSSGLYQTRDSGAIWEPTKGWQTLSPTLYSIATHPISDTVMFAGSGNWEFSGGEIYKTQDAGQLWYTVSPQYTNALTFAFAPSDEETLLAGTQLAGIMKSTDGGESWVFANDGLPTGVTGAKNISSLVFHSKKHRWVYAASSLGVFVSYDLADEWKPLWSGITANALIIDSQNEGNIYAGTNKGIFVSYDDGLNWSQLGQCGVGKVISQLAVDPTNSNIIWVGTNDGIWRCTLK